jgi:flavin-dependent dehydrogenase
MWAERSGGGIIPTTDGVVAVYVGMPPDRFATEARGDIEGTYVRLLNDLDADRASAVLAGTPAGPMRSFPGVPGRFVRPQGRGWALVGDAGYFKDPYAAHGMTDAFRDAELLADAVVSGDLVGYERARDRASLPVFEALERILSSGWDLSTLPGLIIELNHAIRDELTLGAVAA